MKNVIDISQYNKVIAYSQIPADCVYVRMGYRGYTAGTIKADTSFIKHINGLRQANVPYAYYFMSQAINVQEAIEEAVWCDLIAKQYGNDPSMPFVYDSELSNSKGNGRADKLTQAQRTDICKAFCDKLISLGRKAGVYASESWYKTRLNLPELTAKYMIWVAKYGTNTGVAQTKPSTASMDMWQYTSKGTVKGIIGDVDMSYYYDNVVADTPDNGLVTYSLKTDGTKKVSANFAVKEFKCKDGSDKLVIDVGFVRDFLQRIRCALGVTTINSAYRTAAYNKKVGGAAKSYHLTGQAFDISVKGKSPLEVARYAESLGIKGIGLYGTFVHVDSRKTKYYWNSCSGKEVKVNTFK